MTAIDTKHIRGNIADEIAPMVHPDVYFSEEQIHRLQYLMGRVQEAEAPPEDVLSIEEYEELTSLIKAELQASAQRSAALIAKAAS